MKQYDFRTFRRVTHEKTCGVKTMIETNLLAQLTAFARLGTLSAAAEELHISQPALSRSMQKLEEQLGVALFARGKNKIALNEAGQIAAERAERVLKELDDLTESVRAFDRRRRTIALGSCAPVPRRELQALLPSLWPEMTSTSELTTDAPLLGGLRDGTYQLAVLHELPDDEAIFARVCGRERLYLSLPKGHALASREQVCFADMDGMTMLLYSAIGFWYGVCMEKMPRTKFLLQSDRSVFGELVSASELPCFMSSFYLRRGDSQAGRVSVPIAEPEAEAVYWLACLRRDRARYAPLFDRLPLESLSL